MPPSRGHGAGEAARTSSPRADTSRRSSFGSIPRVTATASHPITPQAHAREPDSRRIRTAGADRPPRDHHEYPYSRASVLLHPHIVVFTVLALVLALTCTPVVGAPVPSPFVTAGGDNDSSSSNSHGNHHNDIGAIASKSHATVSAGDVHVTGPAPQVQVKVIEGVSESVPESQTYKSGSGADPDLKLDSSSPSENHNNPRRALPPPPMNAGDSATEAAIRAAFAAVVDPVGSWFVDEPSQPQGGWGSHFSLLFGFGGEGSMSVLYQYATGGTANVSLPHRPAAFPAFLPPDTDLPVQGTLVPFASLPGPNSTTIGADSVVGGHGPNPDLVGDTAWSEPPERACVPRTWPPIRPSAPEEPYVIALVERGGCDFATKVRAAQERGAAAVVVGDKKLRDGETDEEGRRRESLLTMFSPEDTSGIIIPSVFVSRASYLLLRDLLRNQTLDGKPGLKVDVGPADDDGSALGSLLTFALLMPTLFLLATVTAHRVRVARQREANRAPPTVVLSLPERVWTPDIVWEKDSDDSDKDEDAPPTTAESDNVTNNAIEGNSDTAEGDVPVANANTRKMSDSSDVAVVESSDAALADHEGEGTDTVPEIQKPLPVKKAAKTARKRDKTRRKSKTTKRYYSKDECAICMDNFHRGEIVRILPCGHVFHKDECDEWLLKWRKLCPTCRADVTISSGDLSASATLTPVVDPDTAAAAGVAATGLGAEVEGDADAGTDTPWRQRIWSGISGLGARAEAAVVAVGDSFRAAVGRGSATNTPVNPIASPRTTSLPSAADERTPLLGP